MDTVRAAIGNSKQRVRRELVLNGHAPELRLSNVDVVLIVAQFNRGKRRRSSTSDAQRTEVVVSNYVRTPGNFTSAVCGAIYFDHGARRWIKTLVVGYV